MKSNAAADSEVGPWSTTRGYQIFSTLIACHGGTKPGWDTLGIVFDPRAKTVLRELKRPRTGYSFVLLTKEEAEDFGLALCQTWIDGLKR